METTEGKQVLTVTNTFLNRKDLGVEAQRISRSPSDPSCNSSGSGNLSGSSESSWQKSSRQMASRTDQADRHPSTTDQARSRIAWGRDSLQTASTFTTGFASSSASSGLQLSGEHSAE